MSGGAVAAVRAGMLYFAAVFALGFVLGVLRIVVLVPRIGPTAAVMAEIPAMLTAAWLICGAVLARIPLPPRVRDRLAMGGVALGLLWLAEALLSAATGVGARAYLASLVTPAGLLGIAAQLAFGVFPLIQGKVTPS